MSKFVGRTKELTQIKRTLDGKKPTISVVYGRRRIGKTSLIRQALKNKSAFFFEGLEVGGKKEQLSNFVLQLRRQFPLLKKSPAPKTWREAFFALEEPLRANLACVVLDEIQWMAGYRSDLISDLKMVWEQSLSMIPGAHLILCGSIASFMTTRVIKSNALYGRTDLVVHLREFKLAETKKLLGAKGTSEILDAQMMVGGVPKYLELLQNRPSIHRGMEELAFQEHGFFLDEYDRIFTSHFGKNHDYQRIVDILAKKPYGLFRKEIAKQTGIKPGGGLSELIKNLESAGFISSFVSFDKGHKSRIIKYHLHDAYLRFYFAFIKPNQKKIESGTANNIFSRITQSGHFYTWRGRAFELVCLDHASRIAELLGFAGVDYSHGPYFRAPTAKDAGFQIDLLFYRADKVITLCEMKCTRIKVGRTIEEEVEKKVQILRRQFPSMTIQRVLVLNGDVTQSLRDAGYFYKIIHGTDLF